ncbi:AMIN domain-containing protein [bacterium]|nr:AMIN domain-containing protein [bacterium]
MSLPNDRRIKAIRNLTGLCILFVVLSFTQASRANPMASTTLDDIRFTTCGEGCIQVIVSGSGELDPGQATYIANPARLVYDFKDTVLGYNDGRTRKFPIEVGDLNTIGISQYKRHPDVVRLVLYFRSGNEKSLRNTILASNDDGKLVMTYSLDGTMPGVEKIPGDSNGLIDKLLHQRMGPERDRFDLHGDIAFEDPVVRFVKGGLIINLKGIQFKVPAESGNNMQVPVSGALIDEIQVVNQPDGATLFLRIKDSARTYLVDYEIDRNDSMSLGLEVHRSYQSDSGKELAIPKPKPVTSSDGKVTGMVYVLGSSMEKGDSVDASGVSRIIRIQYQPLSIGERFIIEATGDFNPSFQKLGFPNRLNMRSDNTTVILPREADDKFQVRIEGAMSKLMKVFLKDHDGTPESVIQFYYEIEENEDIQYDLYITDTENVYYLDLIPIAMSYSATPPVKVDIPLKPEQAPIDLKPVVTIPVEPVKAEKVETVEAETVEPEVEPVEDDVVSFNIPNETEYESVVSIPISPDKIEETAEPAEPVMPIEPEIEKEPEVVVEKPVESIVEIEKNCEAAPEPVKAAPVETSPVRIEFVKLDNFDRFIISSDTPIDEYNHNELNYPSRFAIEFPGRSIDFNALESGKSRYIQGNATESVRIIARDLPVQKSVFYIFLNGKWDETDCEISGSPNRIVIDVRSLASQIEEQIDETITEPTPAFFEPDIIEVEPEPEPVVEIPKVVNPEVVKPVTVATVEPEEEESRSMSFLLDDVELDKDDAIEEVIIEAPVVEVIEEEPIEEEVAPLVEDEPIQEAIVEEEDDFIEIKVSETKEEKPEETQVAALYHKTDAFPLKKGEIKKADICINSIKLNGGTGLGQIIVYTDGGRIPEPDVKWWNYPVRLSFDFDDIGVDLNGVDPTKWSSDIDSTVISRIQVDQHSGGRVPLGASMNLYLNPGYDSSNISVSFEPVSDSALKISFVEPGQLVAQVEPEEIEEPKEPENTIKITDEDFTIEDLESEPAEEAKSETTLVAGTGRYLAGSKVAVVSEDGSDGEGAAEEPLVTMVMQNAEIEDLLFLIAENTGIDISIESRSVRGTISLKITKKPISEVFDLIATQGNFKWNNYKGTYIFGSEDFIWDIPGVITPRVIRLKYADPLRVRQVLTQLRLGGARSVTLYQAGNIGSSSGRGQVPTAQNALILKGDTQQLRAMMDVIKQIDVPPLLIKVNMKVIEYSLANDKNTGFNWSIMPRGGSSGGTDKGFISFSLAEKADPGGLPLTFQGFKRQFPFDISMIYNFLEDKGDAKLLADSTLTVTNGGRGEFFVGETVPYRSTFQVSDFGRVTQRVQQESVGINMSFQAQASDDGMITLYIDPNISNLKEITDIGPRTSNKTFKTTIRIPSGQPYAIGGLINESDRTSYDKIPFLGDLPLLGNLFKGKSRSVQRSEMVIVFTPEIVHDAATRKYSDIYDFEPDEGVAFSLND